MNRFTILLALLLLVNLCAEARIVRIPQDWQQLSRLRTHGWDGDTVIISDGNYEFDITVIGDMRVVIASEYLLDRNEAHIEATQIHDTPIMFGYECNNSELIGLTFTQLIDGLQISRSNNFTVKKCVFSNSNTAINIRDSEGIIFDHCTIEQNYDEGLDGVISCEDSDLTFNYCHIHDNTSNQFSAGIKISGGKLQINNCIFEDNDLLIRNEGIALNIFHSRVLVQNSIFRNNHGRYSAPTIYVNADSCVFTNCLIDGGLEREDNSRRAISLYGVNNQVLNCTIVNCTDGTIKQYNDNRGIVRNCIIVDNGDSELQGNLDVSWSDIDGGFEGEGNIDNDPLFIDRENGNYHLSEDSPCINMGDPDSPLDVDGTRADMGAFPYLWQSINVSDTLLTFQVTEWNESAYLTLTLTNVGALELEVYGAYLDNDPTFELLNEPDNIVLDQNEQYDLVVGYTALDGERHENTITIESNDIDQEIVEVQLISLPPLHTSKNQFIFFNDPSLIGYPNPFNSSTTITYSLPFSSDITLSVFDLSGRRVADSCRGMWMREVTAWCGMRRRWRRGFILSSLRPVSIISVKRFYS